jgi:hypothetical protein
VGPSGKLFPVSSGGRNPSTGLFEDEVNHARVLSLTLVDISEMLKKTAAFSCAQSALPDDYCGHLINGADPVIDAARSHTTRRLWRLAVLT